MSLDSRVAKIDSADRRTLVLRASTPSDAEFVNRLTEKVMGAYVAATWPLLSDQEAYFKKNLFVCQSTRIIQMDGKDIGRLTVVSSESSVTIDNIHLLPEYQGFGIGKELIQSVIRDARSSGKSVELQLLIVNPALKLYERLGFEIYRRDEERLYMRLEADCVSR